MIREKTLHEYLPAIYQKQESVRNLLNVFAQHFEILDSLLAESHQYVSVENNQPLFDDRLHWLASWVDLDLDIDWDDERKLRLLKSAIQLYRRRGTVGGLRDYLSIYTGLEAHITPQYDSGCFQMGIASRIGGFVKNANRVWSDDEAPPGDLSPGDDAIQLNRKLCANRDLNERDVQAREDYYVITPRTGKAAVYRVDDVEKISIEVLEKSEEGYPFKIAVRMRPSGKTASNECEYPVARIRRYDDMSGPRIFHSPSNPGVSYSYSGDSCLIAPVEIPYAIDVELSGLSLQGIIIQLAAEWQRQAEALFTKTLPRSNLCAILTSLENGARKIVENVVVSSDLPLQLVNVPISGDADTSELISELTRQLDTWLTQMPSADESTQDAKKTNICSQIVREYIHQVAARWAISEGAEVGQLGLAELRQRNGFDELCRVHFAEVLLRSLLNVMTASGQSAKDQACPFRVAQIERYMGTSAPGEDELEDTRRVRALLNREKPAHVHCTLRIREAVPSSSFKMQIGIHSIVCASTVIG